MHKPILCDCDGFSSFWYCLGKLAHLKETDIFQRIDGLSYGAIVATLIICLDDINVSNLLLVAIKSKSFDISNTIYKLLDQLLPINAHIIAKNKLGIVQNHNIIIRQWDTREMLINSVIESTYINRYFCKNLDQYDQIIRSHKFSFVKELFYISVDEAKDLYQIGKLDILRNIIRDNEIIDEICLLVIILAVFFVLHYFTHTIIKNKRLPHSWVMRLTWQILFFDLLTIHAII